MKEIILKFKTPKGVKAYYEVDAEGKSRPYMERKISKAVATDSIISKKPLIVRIKIKVERLAIQAKLDEQIVTALEKKGAKKNKDYTMEVRY